MRSMVIIMVVLTFIGISPVLAGDMLEVDVADSVSAFWYHYSAWKELNYVTQVVINPDYSLMEFLAGPVFNLGPIAIEFPAGLQLDIISGASLSRIEHKIVSYNTAELPLGLNFLSLNVFRWRERVEYTDQIFLREQVYMKYLGIRFQSFKDGGGPMQKTIGPLLHYKFSWFEDGHIYLYYGFDLRGRDDVTEVDFTLARW